MTNRVIDFDAFRAERKSEPLELKIGGTVFQLPAALPAALALDIVRLNALGEEAEVPMEDVIRVGQAIFGGEEGFRRVLEEGRVTLPELPDLIKHVVEAYTSGTAKDETDPSPPTQE